MKNIIMTVIIFWLLPKIISGQQTNILSGRILDESKEPLPGATVSLNQASFTTVADLTGHFIFSDLPKGDYAIEISFLGFKKYVDTIYVADKVEIIASLEAELKTLQEAVVVDNYAETRKKEESLNIEVVNDDFLRQNLGGSLMKSLERLPGVSSIDIGSGQSKPVIRGLGFNRIGVIENGIKHEGQQWGSDHGLEIDQFSVDRVEVIKGPASLMYGSDAIGGIIDLKQIDVPAINSFGGSIDLTAKSNNNLLGTSALVYARKGKVFFTIRGTLQDFADYRVPTDSVDIYSYKASLYKNRLRNTAGKEKGLHFSVGYVGKQFSNRLYFSMLDNKYGFFANAHGLEPRNVDTELHDKSDRDIQYPYQEVNHVKLINKTDWWLGKFHVESELGFQRNFREEFSKYVQHGFMPATFPDSLNFDSDLERQFDKYIYSGNIKTAYSINEKSVVTIGLNSEYQDNSIDGRGFIIPAFKQLKAGVFLYSKYKFSANSFLHAGIRYDYGHIAIDSYYDWFPTPVSNDGDTVYSYLERSAKMSRDFSNLSWSAGYNYNPGNFVFKLNVGKSFRIPIAKELGANGVNYHHFSYEVGNQDLSPEISYQLDAGMEYNSKKFAIGATPFLNYFLNYIYLNPSSEHDRLYGNGNQKYYYTQSKVFRYGGEIHAHYDIIKPLQIGLIGEYVYSEQISGEKKGFTLPFSPPASAILNIKYKNQKVKFIGNGYISLDYKIIAPQMEIVPPEETTDGYQVINLGLGGNLRLKNQKVTISMQVQNLLNSKYFNHTSYYRLINLPEPGRNFIVNITIPFSGRIKQM